MKREVLSLQTNSRDKVWQFLNIQVSLPSDAQTRRQADSVPRSSEYSGGTRITHRPEDPQFGGFSCFSIVSPRKRRALAKIRPRPLPSTSFPIQYSLKIKTQSKTTKLLSRDCWIFSRYFKPLKGYSGATVTNRTVNRSINRKHHYRITADKIGL
jgi:hypothetical protein